MASRFSDFAKSPQSGSYLSVAGLILAVISLVVTVLPLALGDNTPRQLEWIIIVCLSLLLVALIFMYRLFVANFDDAAIAKQQEAELRIKQDVISDKEKIILGLEEKIETLNTKRLRIAEVFKDLSVDRAVYSGVLQRIQDLILHASSEMRSKAFFPHSRRRFREILEHTCNYVGHVFEEEKGEHFNVNIKFVVAINQGESHERSLDFLHTAGISRQRPPSSELIAYRTVARCDRSRNKNRGDDREESAMSAQDNLILRDIVEKKLEFLLIEDTAKYISNNRWKADKKEIKDFVYPDSGSAKKYTSALVVPLVGQFSTEIVEANERIPITEHQLYGFLAVDTYGNKVLNKELDVLICQEAGALIMSILREYGRCISHWDAKFGQTLGKLP